MLERASVHRTYSRVVRPESDELAGLDPAVYTAVMRPSTSIDPQVVLEHIAEVVNEKSLLSSDSSIMILRWILLAPCSMDPGHQA